MHKAYNAKQTSKKSQMAIDKAKKSASIKKNKSKKFALTKSDLIFDQLEVEGVLALEQTGADSDCSSIHQNNGASPTPSRRPSITGDTKNKFTANNLKSTVTDNNKSAGLKNSTSKSNSARNSPLVVPSSAFIQHALAMSTLIKRDADKRKVTVSFSNFDEIQSLASLSTMAVKTKSSSQQGKSKSGLKHSADVSPKNEKIKTEQPTKSCINKAVKEIIRLRSEESLRWEYTLQDEVQELERIRVYKINRRKRYLALAQEKGLGWVINYGINVSPLSDESVMDLH